MDGPSEPLQVATLSAAVYDRVKALLFSGHFKPGQWIRERELTDMLNVSRTPVREALRILEQERLVDSWPRRGFRMRVPHPKELTDFYELRAELEGLAAQLAAERASAQALYAIAQALELARDSLGQHDGPHVIAGNNAFHEQVAMASGNRVLLQSLTQLRDGVNLYRTLSWSTQQSRPPVTLQQHQMIYEAIRDRDARTARERARAHVWDSLPLAMEALRALEVPDG
jgi:DNA-binding GntR family transcriptional regulator